MERRLWKNEMWSRSVQGKDYLHFAGRTRLSRMYTGRECAAIFSFRQDKY